MTTPTSGLVTHVGVTEAILKHLQRCDGSGSVRIRMAFRKFLLRRVVERIDEKHAGRVFLSVDSPETESDGEVFRTMIPVKRSRFPAGSPVGEVKCRSCHAGPPPQNFIRHLRQLRTNDCGRQYTARCWRRRELRRPSCLQPLHAEVYVGLISNRLC